MASTSVHGIVSTGSGGFYLTTLRRTGKSWRVASTRQWNTADRLATALLGSRGVCLGVPSFWRSTNSPLALGGVESAAGGGPLAAQSFTAQTALNSALLAANCTAVYPDDAYLCTLPLALVPGCPASFLSIHSSAGILHIAAILDRTTACTMMFPADGPLQGALDRIDRFLRKSFPGATMPETIVTVNETAVDPAMPFKLLRLDCSSAHLDGADTLMLKSAGVALAPAISGMPPFAADCSRSRVRLARTALVSAAIGLFALSLLALLTVSGLRIYAGWHLRSARAAYARTLNQSADLKSLLDKNESIARRAVDLEQRFAHKTNWTALLSTIGSARPDGLYLDRFGSEGLDSRTNAVKIALSGWAGNDTAVTRFIGRLQAVPFISDISLSSMEQSAEYKHSLFTIVCSAHF